MSDDQKTCVIASIRDWFLDVCAEDERYQGDNAKVHAQRDAHDVFRSVVAPLLAEKDSAFAKLSDLNEMERATRAREAANEAEKFKQQQEQLSEFEDLMPQQCERGVHPDWLADTEDVVSCPWCAIDRLRREVEFEANGIETAGAWFGFEEPRRACACVTALQAQTLRDLGVLSPPQCSVHEDGRADEWQPGDPVYADQPERGHCSNPECGTSWVPADAVSCPTCGAPAGPPVGPGVLPEGGAPDA